MKARAREIIAGVTSVASPPLVYERLVRVINDPRSGSADIARVIGEDQGLTARLLRIVNSAFFSFPRRIETVSHAVTVVGTRQVRDLAMATSVINMFDALPADLIDMKSFWHHSLACGVTARAIAGYRQEDNVERFFVAGLLHDIGRLVMFQKAGDECREALTRSRAAGMPLYAAEEAVLGCHHAHVGDALLESWNFPGSLREAVAYHHHPALATRFPAEAAAVHVADIMATALGWGRSGETRVPPFHAGSWEVLGVDVSLIPLVIDEAERQMEAAVLLLAGDG